MQFIQIAFKVFKIVENALVGTLKYTTYITC